MIKSERWRSGALSYLFILTFIYIGLAIAQSSTNYKIEKDVLDTAGAPSASTNYTLEDAIGQPSAIGNSSSSNYDLWTGYLANLVTSVSAIEEIPETQVPESFNLNQNYPNPFNPITIIKFTIPNACEVTLSIYNTLGEVVAILVSERLSAGTYSYQWDALNLPSGLYLYRFETEEFVQTKKLILMR
jgi:hypothetical protein